MARLVNMLILSVRDAQEWLRKTQLHQEEGEKSQGDALGLVALVLLTPRSVCSADACVASSGRSLSGSTAPSNSDQ